MTPYRWSLDSCAESSQTGSGTRSYLPDHHTARTHMALLQDRSSILDSQVLWFLIWPFINSQLVYPSKQSKPCYCHHWLPNYWLEYFHVSFSCDHDDWFYSITGPSNSRFYSYPTNCIRKHQVASYFVPSRTHIWLVTTFAHIIYTLFFTFNISMKMPHYVTLTLNHPMISHTSFSSYILIAVKQTLIV